MKYIYHNLFISVKSNGGIIYRHTGKTIFGVNGLGHFDGVYFDGFIWAGV